MAIVDAALAWAARGFSIFPLLPGDKVPLKGTSWKTEATTDTAKIKAWWAFNPEYNYGVAGGNGIVIVDVDAPKGGLASLLDLDLPLGTLTVKTPGGGLHLYLKAPDIANTVDRIAPGIDVRSAGGYVVGPGCYFSDPGDKKGYKGSYQIEIDGPVLDATPGFLLLAGEAKGRETGPALSVDDPADIMYATHYLLKDAPTAVEGRGGNNTTYAVAARMVELGVSAAAAADLMLEHWNERCSPPWGADELRAICENAQNYSQRRQGAGGVAAAAAGGGDTEDVITTPTPTSDGKFDKIFSQRTMTPLNDIPVRKWIMHRLLMRDEVSVLAGPGGVGKSGFSLAVAAHGAVGRSFDSFAVPRPFKTIVYNLEDGRHEMEARLYAACATYGLDPEEVQRHVLLWPGRETRFRVLSKDHTVIMADVRELVRLTKRDGFDVMILDPLIGLHHEKEEDNMAMGEVMDALNGLARLAGVAVLALHHTPKGVRQAGSSDAVRGAGNIVNAVRIASTIYSADEGDAALFGLGEGYKAKFIRIDDAKQNNAAMSTKPLWLEKQNFPMPNGDSSYALRVVEQSASARGEASLIAAILAAHMGSSGTIHLATHDAAKVLTNADPYFKEKVPASGDLRQVKALIELRLAHGVELENGEYLRVEAKTEPGASSARMFVELIDAATRLA